MNSHKKTEEELYDVKSYSDIELYDILDVNNPSDRELEAKIVFLIHKYQNMQNESGNQLARFFKDIHEHFFDIDDADIEFENQLENNNNSTIEIDLNQPLDENVIEGLENMSSTTAPTTSSEITATQPTSPNKTKSSTTDVSLIKTLDIAKDNLNPLLQQTIKRIISVDSQYRDNKKTLSTDFTFILSEPLRDVVSLKLYSVQIPYTWYTINNDFGSNFFYLKGVTPGINDGNFDYQIDISSGNYLPPDLATAINQTFKNLENKTTDVSFGTTNVSYNPNTLLLSTTIDINSIYNETDYYLDFDGCWSSPNDTNPDTMVSTRFQTIPGFLGYNYKQYYPYAINSNANLPLSTDANAISNDISARIYYMDATNNKITIIKYIGPDEYITNVSIIDLSFQLVLPLTRSDNLYTRAELVSSLSNIISNNIYLSSESSIHRIDITDASLINAGQSFYQLKIKLNRKTTNNIPNSKLLLLFPSEVSKTTNNIWIGSNSCFQFKNISNEINNIIGETSPVAQQGNTYIVGNLTQTPYLKLTCNSPNFTSYTNDISINVASSNIIGYTQNEYINAINNGIVNAATKYTEISTQTTTAYIDTHNSIFNYQLDINKTFNQSQYILDASTVSGLHILGITGIYDLSKSNIINSQFNIASSYTITGNILSTITASSEHISNSEIYSVSSPDIKTYTTYLDLQNAINKQFQTYTTAGQSILSGANVAFNINATNNNLIDCSFTVSLQRTLTERDYGAQFIDPTSFVNTFPVTNECTLDISHSILHTLIDLSATLDLSGQNTFTSYFSEYTITGNKLATIYPRTYSVNLKNTTDFTTNITIVDNNSFKLTSTGATNIGYTIPKMFTSYTDFTVNTSFINNDLSFQLIMPIGDLRNYKISVDPSSLFAILFNVSGNDISACATYYTKLGISENKLAIRGNIIENIAFNPIFLTLYPTNDISFTINIPTNPYNNTIPQLSSSINNQIKTQTQNIIRGNTYDLSGTRCDLSMNPITNNVDCSFNFKVKYNDIDVTSMYLVDLSNTDSYLYSAMDISSNQPDISNNILDLNSSSFYRTSFPQYFNKYSLAGKKLATINHTFDSNNKVIGFYDGNNNSILDTNLTVHKLLSILYFNNPKAVPSKFKTALGLFLISSSKI
jgi:hypothetical protein